MAHFPWWCGPHTSSCLATPPLAEDGTTTMTPPLGGASPGDSSLVIAPLAEDGATSAIAHLGGVAPSSGSCLMTLLLTEDSTATTTAFPGGAARATALPGGTPPRPFFHRRANRDGHVLVPDGMFLDILVDYFIFLLWYFSPQRFR